MQLCLLKCYRKFYLTISGGGTQGTMGEGAGWALLVPESVLERVDLPGEAFTSLSGVIQLPLQLPAGSVGPGGLLLRLLQLTLQLLHTRVGFLHLTGGRVKERQTETVGGQRCSVGLKSAYWLMTLSHVNKKRTSLLTCSLYWSAWRRSSSTCIITSFNFFSVRRTILLAAALSLQGYNRERYFVQLYVII